VDITTWFYNRISVHGKSLVAHLAMRYAKKLLNISSSRDPVGRRIWEDALSTEPAGDAVTPTSSYQLFPDARPDTDQALGVVQ
jgi:hypothetical protein